MFKRSLPFLASLALAVSACAYEAPQSSSQVDPATNPPDACGGPGTAAYAACSGAIANARACCHDGAVGFPFDAEPGDLCEAARERFADPVTWCNRVGAVAGSCDGARRYIPRAELWSVPLCCCPDGQRCGEGYDCR